MDAYKGARPAQRRWTAAPNGSQSHSWLVESTRYKLADLRLSILYSMDELDNGAFAEADRKATERCGAYLAHARQDLTFDEIRFVLSLAGGNEEAINGLDAALHDWRYRGGYTEQEHRAASLRSRAGHAAKKGGLT